MNCSVNLVPRSRRFARARVRRRNGWTVACIALAVLVCVGWGLERVATGALATLEHDVSRIDARRTNVQNRLEAADELRTLLLAQLETVCAARRPQPWAGRLVQLTTEAPPGILLTAITIGSSGGEAMVSRGSRPPTESRRNAAGQSAQAKQQQAVRLVGYALDHPTLLQFYNVVQRLPGWDQVELVRATLEPYRGGVAVAFELDCRMEPTEGEV